MAAARSHQLLRYRFDRIDQVSRHFHVTPGRVLLFYPTIAPLAAGQRVLLDVSFSDSEQHCSIRGAILGRGEIEAPYLGWWLEFSAYNVVASIHSGANQRQRRQRRFATDVVMRVQRRRGMPDVARLTDLSLVGGRLTGGVAGLASGEEVRLSPVGATPTEIPARVVWARNGEVGFDFGTLATEHRAIVRGLVENAAQELAASYEARHPHICRCLEGLQVVEPAMPRVAHRRVTSR